MTNRRTQIAVGVWCLAVTAILIWGGWNASTALKIIFWAIAAGTSLFGIVILLSAPSGKTKRDAISSINDRRPR